MSRGADRVRDAGRHLDAEREAMWSSQVARLRTAESFGVRAALACQDDHPSLRHRSSRLGLCHAIATHLVLFERGEPELECARCLTASRAGGTSDDMGSLTVLRSARVDRLVPELARRRPA